MNGEPDALNTSLVVRELIAFIKIESVLLNKPKLLW